MHLPILPVNEAAFNTAGDLADRISAYNAAAGEHNAAADALTEQLHRFQSNPADYVDHDVPEISAERLRLRQQAIRLRRDQLAKILSDRSDVRRKYAEGLASKSEEARAKILKGLNRLGFVGDGRQWNNQVRGSIYPGMIQNHPDVRGAEDDHRAAQELARDKEDIRENLETIATLESALRATSRQLSA